MAQTVRIKPSLCRADEVQGFTTTVYVAGELDLYSNADATNVLAD